MRASTIIEGLEDLRIQDDSFAWYDRVHQGAVVPSSASLAELDRVHAIWSNRPWECGDMLQVLNRVFLP